MSCRPPAGTYWAEVTPRPVLAEPAEPAAAKPFWAEDPAADDGAAAGTAPPATAAEPAEAGEDELDALPEQPATAAAVTTIRQETAAAPSSRRRGERRKSGVRGECAGTARLIRMPLGRHRRTSRLRRQVTIEPLFLMILA